MVEVQQDSIDSDSLSSTEEEMAGVYKRLPKINGYPEIFSIFPGEPLTIRAARKPRTDTSRPPEPEFVGKLEIIDASTGRRVAIQRLAEPVEIFEQIPDSYRDEGAAYKCKIGVDTARLSAGLYECVIVDDAGVRSSEIYFNVKPKSFEEFDLVCVLPTFTWQAYNNIGGGSFYSKSVGRLRTVSTQRPMSRKADNFVASAIPFLVLFRREGLKVACIDSADLHHSLCPQGAVRVLALLTHDEYWSDTMRAEAERFLRQGTSLLVMAGNVCWWSIEVDGHNISVDKNRSRRGGLWCAQGKPEETTFVSSFRFAGYPVEYAKTRGGLARHAEHLSEDDLLRSRAMTIVVTDHPLFRGVPLNRDNTFGGEVPIMYREIDGVPLTEDGAVDRDRYEAESISPYIIATGTSVNGYGDAGLQTSGVIVEAEVGGGHVLHMGTFGWSLGLAQNKEDVKRVVLNAVRYCGARQQAVQNFTGSRSVQICSRIFQPPRFWRWKRKR